MTYEVIYSDRKTVAITVKDGSVIVRAPKGTRRREISAAVKKHGEWIERAVARQAKRNLLTSSLTEEDIKLLKKNAKIYFKAKMDYYSTIMGLKYGRMTITSAKTRFGSCNSKGNICFSYRLMLYPEAAREYVVVHELAHLVEMNHSARFYKIIEGVLPDYKKRKRLLK